MCLICAYFSLIQTKWLFHWRKHYYGLVLVQNVLFLTNTQLLVSQDVSYLWIIVMFLSAVWTLILTAPIHCRGSIGEQMMQCYISPNLMKKQTHLHLGWAECEYIFSKFILFFLGGGGVNFWASKYWWTWPFVKWKWSWKTSYILYSYRFITEIWYFTTKPLLTL